MTWTGYPRAVAERLVPSMRAGHRLLDVFARRPDVFHALLATPPGLADVRPVLSGPGELRPRRWTGRPVRAALALLDRLPPARQVRPAPAVSR